MAKTGDMLRLPGGAEFRVTQSASETAGERIEMEVTLPPGSPSPPRHFHPQQEEEWTVLAGTLSAYLDGEWRSLGEGESLTIGRGSVHTLRNRSNDVVRVRDVHVPALGFEHYMETLHRLAEAGKLKSLRSPSTLIYFSMVLKEHRDTQITASAPQRAAESVLASIGKALGYRTS